MNAGTVRRHRYCATGTAGMAKVVQLPGHPLHGSETARPAQIAAADDLTRRQHDCERQLTAASAR